MKNLDNWARLAGAAADARDDLRRLLPDLDRAIRAADPTVLTRIRDIAVRHAVALGQAVKHPGYATGPAGGPRAGGAAGVRNRAVRPRGQG